MKAKVSLPKFKIPDYIKQFWKLFRFNLSTLIKFELIFKLVALVLFSPIAVLLLRFAMKVTGYSYITLDNVFSFIIHPFSLILLLLVLAVVTCITVFDIGGILVIFDESYHEDRISLMSAIKHNFVLCRKLFRPKNIGIVYYALFLLPFLSIGVGTNVLSNIRMPEFISDYIFSNRLLVAVLVAIYMGALFVYMNWLYLMHYMVLENKSFKVARKASIALSGKHKYGDLLRILVVEVVLLGVLRVLMAACVMVSNGVTSLLHGHSILMSLAVSILGIILTLLSLVYLTFSNVVNYAAISVLFYRRKTLKGEAINEVVIGPEMRKKDYKGFVMVMAIFFTVAFVGLSAWLYLSQIGKFSVNVESLRDIEITAHRGASFEYPENTMSAFQGAVDAGADWIELDVQQTRDGMIVVSHDANLKRVAGIKKNIYEMDYSELESIDVGSYLDSKYSYERIPTLIEVLIFAEENHIRLNIELKPNEHDVGLEENVVGLVHQFYNRDMCMISSLDYESLRRVKEVDPQMPTLYTLSLASGKIEDFVYADALSVEASSISSRMVRNVHNAGKEIFAWTVNSEESIYEMIELGVDNIISDEVVKARSLVLEYKSENPTRRFIRALDNLI